MRTCDFCQLATHKYSTFRSISYVFCTTILCKISLDQLFKPLLRCLFFCIPCITGILCILINQAINKSLSNHTYILSDSANCFSNLRLQASPFSISEIPAIHSLFYVSAKRGFRKGAILLITTAAYCCTQGFGTFLHTTVGATRHL